MRKEDALEMVRNAPDNVDIVIGIFPECRCEKCGKPKRVLHGRYNVVKEKYEEVCGDCVVNEKMRDVRVRKEKRAWKRDRERLRKPSTRSSRKREEILAMAVEV